MYKILKDLCGGLEKLLKEYWTQMSCLNLLGAKNERLELFSPLNMRSSLTIFVFEGGH
jgi:hypothetical protein